MALLDRLKGWLGGQPVPAPASPAGLPVAPAASGAANTPTAQPATVDAAADAAEEARKAGNAALRAGDAAVALAHYERFAALRPLHAPAQVNCAFALFRLGRLAESEAAYRRARELDPADHEAAFFLGECLAAQQRHAEAEAQQRQVVALKRDFAAGWIALAQALELQGRYAEAQPCLATATHLEPGSARAWQASARVALHLGEPADAMHACERWLAIEPRAAEALGMRADALRQLGRLDDALQSAEAACALAPEEPRLAQARGAALLDLRRYAEAEVQFERAISQGGETADALASLGAAFCGLHRPEAALPLLDRALVLEASHPDALHLRALALMNLLRFDEAADFLQQQVERHPADARLQFDLAVAWLSLGRWHEGWRQYQWRLVQPPPGGARSGVRSAAASTGQTPEGVPETPGWPAGAELLGQRLLLTSEQGLGDALQFIRYVPAVLARGAAQVALQVSPRLLPLLPAPWPGCRLIETASAEPPFDRRASLLSLPYLLGMAAPLGTSAPYVQASAARREHWRQRLGGAGASTATLRVGLVWAGNPDHPDDARRSLALALLRDALHDLPSVLFVSLQMELRESDQAAHQAWPGLVSIGAEQTDMADSAALIEELDLVVSVDTSVAHLAGALGHPCVLLLQHCPDWRWGLAGESTLWYPSLRLLRQARPGDWASVLQALRELLQARADAAVR